MQNVLITGANGFIGRRLIGKLLSEGLSVYGVSLSAADAGNLRDKGYHCIHVDTYDNICEKLKSLQLPTIDTIYHLAWGGVSTRYKNDFKVQYANIKLTLKGIDIACALDCKRVICLGSVSEYAYSNVPVTGEEKPTPSDMYAACKAAAHFITGLYSEQKNVELIWLLASSVYGPGREDDNIISYTIKKLLNKESPSYTKLEQKWDYIFIDDFLDALYLAGRKGRGNVTYAVGSGEAHMLREYIEIIHNLIDSRIPLGIGDLPYKTNHIDNSLADISPLREDTGFTPHITFEEGIAKTIAWFRNYK